MGINSANGNCFNMEKKLIGRISEVSYFSCEEKYSKSSISKTHSYMKSGSFQMILNGEVPISNDFIAFTFFGKTFSAESAVWTNTRQLFSDIKKEISILKAKAHDNIDLINSETALISFKTLQKDISEILLYFTISLQKLHDKLSSCHSTEQTEYSQLCVKNYLTEFVKELKKLLLFVGRIRDIPDIIHMNSFVCGDHKSSFRYWYLHLCLDIWWNALQILHIAQSLSVFIDIDSTEIFCDNAPRKQQSIFSQTQFVVLHDLFYIAFKLRSNARSDFNLSPFFCNCVREFWTMLIKLTDKHCHLFNECSFWETYYCVVQQIVSKSNEISNEEDLPIDTFSVILNDMKCNLPIEMCLWLTSHIAVLYKYDEFGYYAEYKDSHSAYMIPKYLVESALTSENFVIEKNLRSVLYFCTPLVTLWKPTGDILLPLTDFYIKKIGEMFILNGAEGISFSYLFKTSSMWIEHIKSLLTKKSSLTKETSFDLYLFILATQIQKTGIEGNLWRQLKGRIFSKFTPKKMKELSEVGLQNCFTLFLVIACSLQLEEITVKLCELATIVETTSNFRKQMISWKALFSIMYIYQEKKRDMQKITSKISQFFNSVCSDYAMTVRDSMHKANVMNLLMIYIDNMRDILDKSDAFHLSTNQLITSGFSVLLPTLGISELNYVLGVFLDVLAKLRRVADNDQQVSIEGKEHESAIQLLFQYVYPTAETLSFSDTPPVIIADIAAALTMLLCKPVAQSEHNLPKDFTRLFRHFGTKDNVNSAVTCRYLCFILNDCDLIESLKSQVPDLNSLILQSWVKCVISLPPPCTPIEELTRVVLQQKELLELFPEVKALNFSTGDQKYMSIKLYKIMGETYERCPSLQEKNKLKEQVHLYFKTFVPCIFSKIKQETDNHDLLNYLYGLASHLVEYCGPLLYMKFNSDSILPKLLDTILFPHLMFPKDKTVPPTLTRIVREHLLPCIRGICKLEYRKDKCIERKFKDIITYYLGQYPVASNPITTLAIAAAFHKPNAVSEDAFYFIMDIVKVNFLMNNNPNSKNGFEFCFEIVRQCPTDVVKQVSEILLKNALEQYVKRNDQFSDFLRNCINRCFDYFNKRLDLKTSKVIMIPILEWFIQEKLPWAVSRGFQVLETAIEHLPHVMSDIVPFLTKSIEKIENNRGLGTDLSLRHGLRSVVDKLQKKISV